MNNLFKTAFFYKMSLSVVVSVMSAAAGFLPYVALYRMVHLFVYEVPDAPKFLYWCGIAALGYTLHYLFFGVSTALSHSAAYSYVHDTRMRLAERLLKAPLGKVSGSGIGKIKNVMIEKAEGVERPLAHLIPEFGANTLLALAVFGYLFYIDWRMGLASMVTLPVAAVPMIVTNKGFEQKYKDYMRASDEVNGIIVEYVSGIEVVKMFNHTSRSYEKFSKAVYSYRDFVLAWFRSSWIGMNLILSILPTTFLGTLPVGMILYKSGAITSVELVMCLVLALGLLPVLIKVTTFIVEMKSMKYNIRGVKDLMEIDVLPQASLPVELSSFDISFQNVGFSYTEDEEQKQEVLRGLNLDIPQGGFVALVGPSGSGKSTMARLLVRFWDPSRGRILIGGADLKDIPQSQFAGLISYVTQDHFLFNCSLKENIRIGNPHASDEEVFAAAKAACCDSFIGKLPDGYDTVVGEGGAALSGGERQRVSIARAILKDAPIVLLDEATAFADPQSEEEIQKSIASLTRDKTLLVIAHRLSTIRNADRIVVLDKGEIVDSGTQEYLLEHCPLYRSLWEAHTGAGNRGITKKEESNVSHGRSNCKLGRKI